MHPQTSSPLFDLLSELRAAIFGFIFQGTIVNKQDRLFVEPTVPECILLICKQAYSEAIVTYWTETTFEFAGLDWAACWVGSLANEAHAALIKEFKIWIMGNKVPGEVGMSCNREEINQHHEAELVEELTMFGFESGDLEVDVRALEMYDGMTIASRPVKSLY